MASSDLIDVNTTDFLDEDPEIRGQKYVCLSFLSPESVIKNKSVFFAQKFLEAVGRDISTMFDNISEKCAEDDGIQDMVKGLRDRYDYVNSTGDGIYEEYESFLRKFGDDIDRDYLEKNNFQTCVRGIKVRGTYDTLPEAQNRAKQIQKFDKNFNVYVAQTGCWCPWEPNPDGMQSEFADSQLNTLMKKYNDNREMKEEMYQQRKGDIQQPVKMHPDITEEAGPSITVTVSELAESLENNI
jgi:hypothetical protein